MGSIGFELHPRKGTYDQTVIGFIIVGQQIIVLKRIDLVKTALWLSDDDYITSRAFSTLARLRSD